MHLYCNKKLNIDHCCVTLKFMGAYFGDQSGIKIVGNMQVSVRLGAILIPEYSDSIPAKSRIAGIYSKNILIPD